MLLKTGDEVIVTVGKDKGKKGKIENVFAKKDQVIVAGVNMYKKHQKPAGQIRGGGIIDINKPLPASNVQVICPSCHLPTRLGADIKEKGKRICRKCKTVF